MRRKAQRRSGSKEKQNRTTAAGGYAATSSGKIENRRRLDGAGKRIPEGCMGISPVRKEILDGVGQSRSGVHTLRERESRSCGQERDVGCSTRLRRGLFAGCSEFDTQVRCADRGYLMRDGALSYSRRSACTRCAGSCGSASARSGFPQDPAVAGRRSAAPSPDYPV